MRDETVMIHAIVWGHAVSVFRVLTQVQAQPDCGPGPEIGTG